MAESLDKPFEMHILGNEEPRGGDVNVAKLCTQDLPSRLARHSTTIVIHQATLKRKYRRTSMKYWEGLPKETSQGRTSHIMQRDNEIKPLNVVSTSQEMLASVDLKAVPLPLSVRRHFRSLKAKTPKRLSLWKAFILGVTMIWTRFRSGIKEFLYSLELWRGHLKDIEGQFGSGVVSYFIFLRWLMLLNLFVFLMAFGFVSLPTLIICARTREDDTQGNSTRAGGCKHESVYSIENNSERGFHGVVIDFITGQGWISDTIMFYSSYPSDAIISQEGVKYHLPFAYLLTGGACFLFYFVMIVQNASIGFREGYIESEGVFHSFSNHLFSAWDYCISEKDAALQKKRIIAQDIQFELDEEARRKRAQNRTKKQKAILYGTRILINLFIVPALWYVSFVVIFGVIINKDLTEHGRNQFEETLIRSSLSLAITILNLILPPLFEFLSMFEDWNPKFELLLNLLRRTFVKIPSIAMLMILLYKNINDRTLHDGGMSYHCKQCWENEIAAQMYMLVWVDFFVVVLVTLGLETARKYLSKNCNCFRTIGMAQFDIPSNVIDLAYGQCLILIGTFFSPILPVIGVLKMIVFFYIKKVHVPRAPAFNKIIERTSCLGRKAQKTAFIGAYVSSQQLET
ncbi:transmembrane channel-like protein 7 isoform X2 [Acropora palmata]|uniref:transmembrane channel-like protein 7 isoform X2 n=1 Tax=Acropora palmata TaxID=6131 RepID=UPI003D9FD643